MHKAKNCIITCIDFRLQENYHKWIKNHRMLTNSDIISVAGCSRDLSEPLDPNDKKFLLSEIEASIQLHRPKTIILLDHQDCGKYAIDQTIPNGLCVAEDMEQHRQKLLLARNILASQFPAETVLAYYFALDGKVTEIL